METKPSDELVIEVTDDQVKEFHERGFISFERITSDAEIEWLRAKFDEVFAPGNADPFNGFFDASRPLGAQPEGEPDLGQAIRPDRRIPELCATMHYRNVRRIAARLLDVAEGDLETWDHMIDKPPHHGHETPWHQDEAFWESDLGYHAVASWTPLDDVDVDNGCMQFLPGSHTSGIRTHRHLYDDPMVSALVVDDVEAGEAVAVPLKAGGATFHTQRTLHHTGPNHTARRRRAYAVEVQLPPVKLEVPIPKPWRTF